MAGTAYLLKDKYNIHVIIASNGELGNTWNTTGEPDPELAALRKKHANKSAETIHAKNYFLNMTDGGVYADEEAVSITAMLLENIDPDIVFLHWPIDKPDHVAASAMALTALSKKGMMYDREIYFFEVGHLNHFTPEVYVDISSIWDVKVKLVDIHERFNDDRYKEMAEKSAAYHGRTNQCKYAEGFKPLFPLSTSRTKCSLLDL
jgi:LmbE family N-acetylglucosaminyl deacetylase